MMYFKAPIVVASIVVTSKAKSFFLLMQTRSFFFQLATNKEIAWKRDMLYK